MRNGLLAPILPVVLQLLLLQIQSSTCSELLLPDRARTQGKVTLSYVKNGSQVKNQLSFSEAFDWSSKRCKVTIGYVGHEPSVYYAASSSPTLRAAAKTCETFRHQSTLIPELAWVVDAMLPTVDLKSKHPFLIGPTGLAILIDSMTNNTKYDNIGPANHKNLPCNLYTRTFDVPEKNLKIESEVFVMSSSVDSNSKHEERFTIKVQLSGSNDSVSRSSIMIEMYDVIAVDQNQVDKLEFDLTLPLGKGCSEFIKSVRPKVSAQTFSMTMKNVASEKDVVITYDHQQNYFRKETIGGPTVVWDMKEDLMYSINLNIMELVGRKYDPRMNLEPCSVLRVQHEHSAAFRPYEKESESLDVLEFLGAKSLSYMGVGFARNMRCDIYEAILDMAPAVFGSTESHLAWGGKMGRKYDFIVQFFMMPESSAEDGKSSIILDEKTFSPLRIMLYRRMYKFESDAEPDIILENLVDIYDFHWSLFGWSKKPAEVFMASECFEEADDEQIEVELAIEFDKIHKNVVNNSDRWILNHNKFRLEDYLIDSVLKYFDISRMHVIDYELKFGEHNTDLIMTIGDRVNAKELLYYGSDYISEGCNGLSTCFELHNPGGEADCVLIGSLMSVEFIAHCQGNETLQQTSCFAFNKTSDGTANQSGRAPNCQVYKLAAAEQPRRGTVNLNVWMASLKDYQFAFEALKPDSSESLELRGSIEHYDVSRKVSLLSISGYKFASESKDKRVRVFNTVTYGSIGDCVRMCDLDSECRSYSFCSQGSENECVMASLNLRDPSVRDQMSKMAPDIMTNDHKPLKQLFDGRHEYELELGTNCSINERDYLNTFVQTSELVSVPFNLTRQLMTAPSVFSCAKRAVELEGGPEGQHTASFAYCAQTDTCLLDEKLFVKWSEADDQSYSNYDDDDKAGVQSLACSVYRRRYQTYFHMSAQISPDQPDQQVQLSVSTVEECARICWLEFGEVCASFDYCSKEACIINKGSVDSLASGGERVSKEGCLHYERDLKLDELRRQHLIGRHQLLRLSDDTSGRHFGWTVLLWCGAILAFTIGMYIGETTSARFEQGSNIVRRSISAASGARSSLAFAIPIIRSSNPGYSSYSDPDKSARADSIQMDVMSGDD